jgi:hypothetical protein
MTLVQEISTKIKRRHYEFSKHAVDQSIIRHISVAELEDAVAGQIEIVEDYPEDKYGSYPSRPLVKIITLYQPDPELWIDFRVRR